MPRKIRDSVVVITGASSGIGRAAALAFARKGASLVLAARREEPLRELANSCERLGGQALAVPTDVTREESVRELARRAIENFGRIDVWVNSAAVTLFARFEEAPPEAYRRVLETNLFGYIYGARAALPYFREQGSGILINNSSVFGKMGAPYLSAYVTSKFAIRGLAECLRQETLDAPIHVCTVLPASIDTPLFQHAANYTGRAIKPLRPVYDAEKVAQAIVDLAENPRREVIVGNAGRMLELTYRLFRPLGERIVARQVEKDHFQDVAAAPSEGNLFRPMPQYTGISGGWREARPGRPVGRVALARAAIVPALLGVLLFRSRAAYLLPTGGRVMLTVGRFLTPVLATLGFRMAKRSLFRFR